MCGGGEGVGGVRVCGGVRVWGGRGSPTPPFAHTLPNIPEDIFYLSSPSSFFLHLFKF